MASDQLARFVYVLVGGAIIFALWRASHPPLVFSISASNGSAIANRGTVTAAFLERVREVAVAHNVAGGEVRGYAQGRFIRLWCSAEFPPNAQQQLRNWWATFGWTSPRIDS